MNFKNYLNQLPKEKRHELAQLGGTSVGQLNNIAYRCSTCAPAIATFIERFSDGVVTRQELRPDDYWLIWPDLPAPATAEQGA
jgi:DNA-binding transcriptional regulator YdaS (Cro superfamily)